MRCWTDVYDGAYAGDDCLLIKEVVGKTVFAKAEDGSLTPKVDEEAMKYLLQHDFQQMQVEFGRRTRLVEKEAGTQFACSWHGQPETRLIKFMDKKEKERNV